MNLTFENILLIGSVLLFFSIAASKTSGKLGVPVLVLFLAIGMLGGSEGIGRIYFDNPKLAQFLGASSLAFILFSGGLETKWESVKPILPRGILLATIGIILTALLVGSFVCLFYDFTWYEGLLLGSIVSSTDAAAVFSILRSRNVGLKRLLRPTLELESGSNDPMAYILTISLTTLLTKTDASVAQLAVSFVLQMIVGAVSGFLMGRAMVWVINHIKLEFEGLYAVLVLSMVTFTFSATDFVGGNGFLAVYLAAIVMGNTQFIHKKSLIRFYDGVAWLMQILMFITLGLLVYPSRLLPVAVMGIAVSLFLIFVARPVAVFVSLAFFRVSFREKLFVSWVGLRGAVPIVFATYPLIAGVAKADMIFNVVFFIVFTSVLLQGTTLPLVAHWLKLSVPEKIRKKYPLELELADNERSALIEVVIPPASHAVGKTVLQLGFPKTSLIVMIKRDGSYITPNGNTRLEQGDQMLIMADSEQEADKVHQVLGV